MPRQRTTIGDLFNNSANAGPAPSVSSTQSDFFNQNNLSDSRNPLTDATTNISFLRSHSLDEGNPFNGSGASRGNMRRWSQTLGRGGNRGYQTVRQRTINHMPSRAQKPTNGENMYLLTTDFQVDDLTKEIEKHDHLMEDNAASEQLRIDKLRSLPQSIIVKRQIKARLTRSVTNKSRARGIGRWKRFKYNLIRWSNRARTSTKNTIYNIELWYDSMKKIEGHFGSGVGTYFKFLRKLFILDVLMIVFAFGFIILPQILYNNATEDSNAGSQNDLTPLDVFSGEGHLTQSILFYGAYSNVTFSLASPHSYNIPIGYFMTMLCMYVVIFIIISVSMATSYRRSFIQTSGDGVQNMYAHKIFCSWDFGISNEKAAILKHSSIYNELKEVLTELNKSDIRPTLLQEFWIMSAQITAHILVFCMLGGLGVGMWRLLETFYYQVDVSPYFALYITIAINVTILIFQFVFSWIARMEEYKSARTTLHINLMRNFLLELVIIGVLIVFWLTRSLTECWETSIGQEIYRLIIIDFIIFGIGGAVYHGIRFCIFKYVWPKIGLPEFDISRGSLGLVFNQTLLWVGFLFSPPLAGIVAAKMILIFYIKKTTLMYFCKPPSKIWRSAQTSTLFLVMTFLSLLGIIVAHGYIITQVKVSESCGPFRNYLYIYEIFVRLILELQEGHLIWRIIIFITKPAAVGGILLAMCAVVYYLRSKSNARVAMVKLLKEMLRMEALDKDFLLDKIHRDTKGYEFLLDDNLPTSGSRHYYDYNTESTSTWNYVNGGPSQSNGRSSNDYQRLSSTNNDIHHRDQLFY